MFMRNQLSEVHIRIFKELPKYLNRLDELEKASAAGDNTEEETERTARIKSTFICDQSIRRKADACSNDRAKMKPDSGWTNFK